MDVAAHQFSGGSIDHPVPLQRGNAGKARRSDNHVEMAAFPRANRFLTRDTVLLVHGRRWDKELRLTGPLSASIQIARETVAQLEIGLQLEKEALPT